jgi:hypothetical protein
MSGPLPSSIACGGYGRRRRRERKWASVGVLWLYGVSSMAALGHYRYASPSELTFRINFLIGGEVMTVLLLILFAPFSVPRRRLRRQCDG